MFYLHFRENIFGYKDLAIQLYYSASKLTTYLNIKYTDKVSPEKFDGLKVPHKFCIINIY
jgi:hypothetical protein